MNKKPLGPLNPILILLSATARKICFIKVTVFAVLDCLFS